MRDVSSRIWRDLRNRRHVDVYAVSFVAFALAVLSVVGDIVPEQIRWGAVLTGVGMLVLRIAVPEVSGNRIDQLLADRFSFDAVPITERLKNANEIWVYAPSAVNLLSAQNCELLRTGCLSRSSGSVRIVVLDATQDAAVRLAGHQLDDSLDYPVQDFAESLRITTGRLRTMSSWQTDGSFEYRSLDYNPGFSPGLFQDSCTESIGHVR